MTWATVSGLISASPGGKAFCTKNGANFMHGAVKVWRAMGRRGAPDVVEVLATQPGPWTLRGLERASRVPLATVRRVLDDLAALGCIDHLRPGRDAQVTWREGPIADWLTELPELDMAEHMAGEFEAAHGREVHVWHHPEDDAGNPRTPVRLAVLVNEEGEEEALERVGPALDALELAGWPAPEVTVEVRDRLDPSDPVAAAMLRSAGS